MAKQKKKGNGCIVVLLWILFLPIMAIIAVAKSKNLTGPAKAGIIAAICLLCIIVGATNGGDDEGTGSSQVINSETEYETQSESETMVVIEEIKNFETTEYVIEVGKVIPVSVKVKPSNITTDDILIECDSESVVEITDIKISNGLFMSELTFNISAIGQGTADVVVKSLDGLVSSNHITVTVEEPSKVIAIGSFSMKYYTQEVGDSIEFTVRILPTGLSREDIVIVNENASVLQINETFFGTEGEYTVFKFKTIASGVGESKITIKSSDGKTTSDTLTFKIVEKDTSRTVYVTPTGEKYHYSSSCAGKNAIETTLNKAIKSGKGPCKKCAH